MHGNRVSDDLAQRTGRWQIGYRNNAQRFNARSGSLHDCAPWFRALASDFFQAHCDRGSTDESLRPRASAPRAGLRISVLMLCNGAPASPLSSLEVVRCVCVSTRVRASPIPPNEPAPRPRPRHPPRGLRTRQDRRCPIAAAWREQKFALSNVRSRLKHQAPAQWQPQRTAENRVLRVLAGTWLTVAATSCRNPPV